MERKRYMVSIFQIVFCSASITEGCSRSRVGSRESRCLPPLHLNGVRWTPTQTRPHGRCIISLIQCITNKRRAKELWQNVGIASPRWSTTCWESSDDCDHELLVRHSSFQQPADATIHHRVGYWLGSNLEWNLRVRSSGAQGQK